LHGNIDPQFVREENIPAEILARGPEAVEAYHKLRRSGTAPLYRGRVFLVGLDRFVVIVDAATAAAAVIVVDDGVAVL